MGMTNDVPKPFEHPDGAGVAPPPPGEITRVQRRSRVVLALALVALGAWTLHRFLPALLWAAILAIALWPLYRRAERRWPPGRHNLVLPSLFTLTVALVCLVPLILGAVQIGHEARGLVHLVEEARQHGIPVPDWIVKLPWGAEAARTWWEANLADPSGYADLAARLNRDTLLSYSREVGAQVVHRSILFGFSLVTLFFLFRDGDRIIAQMRRAGLRALGPHGERIAGQMVASVHGTVDGLVLVGLGEGVILGVAYAIAGVPHPTIFGAATGVAAMIPFVAPLVIGAAVLLLLAAGSAAAAIALAVVGTLVVFVADHFIRPVLIGGATRLPFLWVLLGILGGVETWGLFGLFLGPALMAALMQLWRDWSRAPDGGPELLPPGRAPT